MARSAQVELDDLAWADVPNHALTEPALRTLRTFLATESATFYYLRAAMQTRAASEDPELAPFLCAWAYEEEFHGRAFRRFMECYGEVMPDDYRAQMFLQRSTHERIDEMGQWVLGKVLPTSWPAVHMVWGAIQELTTYSAYAELDRRSGHPVLSQLCRRIMKQELRHFSFYFQQAERRLRDSFFAQQLTSRVLRLAWTPVGDGMAPRSDLFVAIRYLFDGVDGDAIGKIEARIQQLPGLGWFDLFSQYAEEHQLRRAPAAWFPAASKHAATVAAAAVDAAPTPNPAQ